MEKKSFLNSSLHREIMKDAFSKFKVQEGESMISYYGSNWIARTVLRLISFLTWIDRIPHNFMFWFRYNKVSRFFIYKIYYNFLLWKLRTKQLRAK